MARMLGLVLVLLTAVVSQQVSVPARAQPATRAASERVSRLIARGVALQEAGDTISALAYFRDAITAGPRRSEGYVALGTLYLALDEPLRALEVFEAGARFSAQEEALALGLAATLRRLGQDERALAALRQLRAAAPSTRGLRALAEAAEARGAFLEALSARRALLDLSQAEALAAPSPEQAQQQSDERGQVRALELLLGGADRVRSRAACAEPASSPVTRALSRCP